MLTNDEAFTGYRERRAAHWDAVAAAPRRHELGACYHRRLAEIYGNIIPPGSRVLELGCGRGDLLAALAPAEGVGIDFSGGMIAEARSRHPHLRFIQADVHEVAAEAGTAFDAVILSDLVGDLFDVQTVLQTLHAYTIPSSRVILNFYSHLWELPLRAARRLGLATPNLTQSWFAPDDVANLLSLADLEVVHKWEEVLWPLDTPLLGRLANRWLVKLPVFRLLALTNCVVARPRPAPNAVHRSPVVSVVVPARNEAGNIARLMDRTPEMGAGTELIFVEGNSTDDTYAAIERAMADRPDRDCRLLRQTGKGKGDAVRLGFREAKGEVLMILDADMTVAPEDLPRFYEALIDGRADFVNGVRLVYPMDDRAMRFLNLLGNKFFSLAFSWLLGQPIKDTLCGTKVLRRADYRRIEAGRAYFGDFDPFGDFDLIFGAARLNLKFTDIPIRYRERTYGDTNIQRWRHGWLLLRMVAFAINRIKFI